MRNLTRHALHWSAYLLGFAVIVVAACALFLRVVVIPDLDRFRPRITTLAHHSLGLPVQIGMLRGDWQGLHPHFSAENVVIQGPDGRAALTLPKVHIVLSWSSLLLAEVRLAQLELNGLDLEIRRDTQGQLWVAGLPVQKDPAKPSLGDWLLRQHEVVLHNSRLRWLDEARAAPPVEIRNLHMRLDNLLGRHRAGLRATLPPDLGDHLDLRADLRGASLRDPATWSGELYGQLLHTDLDALAEHVPWSLVPLQKGHGSVRAWLKLAQGRLTGVTGDVQLHDTHLTWEGAAPLHFTHLKGRLGWQLTPQGKQEKHELSVAQLTFATPTQAATEPADLRLRFTHTPLTGGVPGSATQPLWSRITDSELEARNLRIEAFTALASSLPLPANVHSRLQRWAPRGYIAEAKGHWQDASHFQITANVSQLGLNANGNFPGFQNLSGQIEASPSHGELRLSSTAVSLDAPKLFAQPLQFRALQGALRWVHGTDPKTPSTLDIDAVQMANADFRGEVGGRLTWLPGQTPTADLTATIHEGRGNAVWRYLPNVVHEHTRTWLRDSLKAGTSHHATLVLKGPLDQYPFERGDGTFRIDVPIEHGRLHYANDWPEISNIQGHLVFTGRGMQLTARHGETQGAKLHQVNVRIPDLWAREHALLIDGVATGAAQAFVDFANHSPVRERSGTFTQNLRARGDASLELKLNLPLANLTQSKIDGRLTLINTLLEPGRGLPDLEHLNGTLYFTQDRFFAHNLEAQLFAQPARINLEPRNNALQVTVQSQLSKADLLQWLPAEWLSRMTGQLRYQIELNAGREHDRLSVSSDLEGLAIDLPAPLGKTAAERTSLHIESTPEGAGYASLKARYGSIASARALFKDGLGNAKIGVRIGPGEAKVPSANGIEVAGSLDRLDLDAWRAVVSSLESPPPTDEPPASVHSDNRRPLLRSIQLNSRELVVMNQALHGARLTLTPNAEGWTAQLESHEAHGSVVLKQRPSSHLAIILKRLDWSTRPLPNTAPTPTTTESAPSKLAGSVQIQQLRLNQKDLGQLSFTFAPIRGGLEIDRIESVQADAKLSGRLKLFDDPRLDTLLEHAELETENLGKLLERLGYPGRIKGGKGHLSSPRLAWSGDIANLTPAKLKGAMTLQFEKGQFLKMEPGIARLLGIFSLQSLTRVLSFNLGSLFGEGFVFDKLNAQAQLMQGPLRLEHLSMDGPPAKVWMTGQVDLQRETQQLELDVEPRVGDSLVAASGLAAGPAGLVGAFVASKVLKKEISQMSRFHYRVTGTWDDPVIKLTQQGLLGDKRSADKAPDGTR